MTPAQWRFEYEALCQKEEQEVELATEMMKTGSRILRDTLIGVLGLHIFADHPLVKSDVVDPDVTPFLPAIFLMGNHHLLTHFMKEHEKSDATEKAVNDDAFEEFSKRLAAGDVGDMDPILSGSTIDQATKNQRAVNASELLRALGVKLRPASEPAAPVGGSGGRRPRVVISDDESSDSLMVGDDG